MQTISLTDLPDLEILKGKENELNWEARDRLITNLTTFFTEQRAKLDYSLAGMSTFSGSFADLRASFQTLPANDARFVISGWIKNYYDDIMLILHTPRTQLSIRTCHFIGSFASFLGPGLFDTYAELSLNHLIKLCGTTKKIIANVAAEVAKNISTLIVPQRAFPVLLCGAIDKNVNCRLRSFECLKIISERVFDESIYQKIWENAVEKVLQKGIGDANAEIRSVALNIFLVFKEKTPDLTAKFMDKLDPSTKKQLGLLLAKTTTTSQKSTKPIVSSVPLAQIRKTLLKDQSSQEESPVKTPSKFDLRKSPSPTRTTPKSPNFKLASPSKSLAEIFEVADVPMDKISIVPGSPSKCDLGSPMKIDKQEKQVSFGDIFMDAQSRDIDTNDTNELVLESSDTDEEVILNVVNAVKSPQSQSNANSVDHLTEELPEKIQLDFTVPMKQKLQHSISSPSIPSRIKSLGLAAGTPLRALYRNASQVDFSHNNNNGLYSVYPNNFNHPNSSLLNDLIEEFCNTREEECFKKILTLTFNRTGDFDGLTSSLVNKLFKTASVCMRHELKMKLLTNFLKNESYLLSLSGQEIIEIIEEEEVAGEAEPKASEAKAGQKHKELIKTLCQSNLISILLESCIEMCCKRVSEFKLVLLAEFIKNSVINEREIQSNLSKCITPLLLALNHPNLNARRLSMNCFIEIRNKFDGNVEKVLNLLDEGKVLPLQRRIIEGFLQKMK